MSIGLPDDVSDRASITIPNGKVGSKSCDGQVELDRIVHVLMNVSVKLLLRKRWRAFEGSVARPRFELAVLDRASIRPWSRPVVKTVSRGNVLLKIVLND